MVGEDLARRAGCASPRATGTCCPDVCLSEGRFLDGTTPADLPRPVEVVPTDGIALRRALTVGSRGMTGLPVVAVVGRPNVGKSTFVNRAVGKRVTIVEDHPGVTRDRKVVEAEWLGRPFLLVDTGGWLPSGQRPRPEGEPPGRGGGAGRGPHRLPGRRSRRASPRRTTPSPRWLRRAGKPVLLGINKADNNQREDERWQFLSLGLGEPYPISALHGRRTGDFLDEVVARLPGPTADGADAELADGEAGFDGDGRSGRRRPSDPRCRHRRAPERRARARCSTG